MTTKPSSNAAEIFDYVIVGGGAAGAILASRLSAKADVTVCLLEAGPSDWRPLLWLPAGFIKVIFNPKVTFGYATEATARTAGRRVPIPQGRTLGGTSSINGLIYNRGQAADYDAWAKAGNEGWSYAEVLPYFKRTEKRVAGKGGKNGRDGRGAEKAGDGRSTDRNDDYGDDRYRGRSGPLTVSSLEWHHPINEAFIDAAVAQGLPRNPDYNGADQHGVGYFQRTIKGRWRQSTARTFLRPARRRPNLEVRTNVQATAVVFDGKRACGVRYAVDRDLAGQRKILARREVILCAGALNTPKLLQLSGVGPAPLLASLGIPLLHELPGVGANLRDHFSVRVVAKVKNAATINEMAQGRGLFGQVARWLFGRPNLLAVSPSLVHWFSKSRKELDRPDLQGVFTPASYKEGYVGLLDSFPGMTAGVWQHRPKSTGYVHAASTDPLAAPLIQPNYLEHPDDRAALLAGMRQARELLRSPALASYYAGESMPGAQVTSDEDWLDFASRYGVSACHVSGTAKMGPAGDPMAVVDAQLRVHGLSSLRVVDASIMPQVPSANTCAATMMIAEKAADMILGRPPLPPERLDGIPLANAAGVAGLTAALTQTQAADAVFLEMPLPSSTRKTAEPVA
jgi:choline dehydrogenase